jgi:serine/threonine protein kinase
MHQLCHPGIVGIVDLLQDESNYYVVLELCPHGDLFQYIVDSKSLKEQEARVFFQQLLEAVHFMHSKGIAHRDLKPENVLLDNSHHLKIADFGFSKAVSVGALTNTLCGSTNYASPELLSGKGYDPIKADVWACGVILYAMLTGRLPWTKSRPQDIREQIKSGDYETPTFLSDSSRDLIHRLICVDSQERITIEEALSHPWLMNSNKAPSKLQRGNATVSLKQMEIPIEPTPDDPRRKERFSDAVCPKEPVAKKRTVWMRPGTSRTEPTQSKKFQMTALRARIIGPAPHKP